MRSFIIFHRHGHRAPTVSAFADAAMDYDWNKILPNADDVTLLSRKFPINNHILNDTPRDIKSNPFGCLTGKGLTHLHSIGGQIKDTLLPNGFLQALSKAPTTFSTNYLRTQMSAQSLASGLGLQELRNGIEVRNGLECPMCIYDAYPELTRRLIAEAQNSEDFKDLEKSEQVVQLKALLLSEFPSLERPGRRFDWMAAFDYFSCRRAHDIDISPKVLSAETALSAHIAARFHLYNRNSTHLALVGAPLLDEIIHAITGDIGLHRRSVTRRLYPSCPRGNFLTIFSCHDVTLLALLHAIGAEQVNGDDCSYWPYYGCNIVFDASCESVQDLQDDTNVSIKVYLDGKLLNFNLSTPLQIAARVVSSYCTSYAESMSGDSVPENIPMIKCDNIANHKEKCDRPA